MAKLRSCLPALSSLAEAYRRRVENEVVGLAADPEAIRNRRAACDADFRQFCRTYFPHYLRSPHESQMHAYLFDRLPQLVDDTRSQSDVIAAPRGEAKSTLVSQLFVLWCALTKRKRFVVVVMNAIDQAYPMLEAIKTELAYNPRLLCDYPEATGEGRLWQAGTIVTANDVKIQIAGSGKKLRGLRHGAARPDLCVLDDIENDEQVRSAEQRDKLESWLKKTVLPLGGATSKFDVIYIGTVLHYDSVLARTMENPLWRARRFQAIPRWPDAMALWDEWEDLLRNISEAAADTFYAAHKNEMDEGAEISWQARPLASLMKIRARDGHDAFDSEYQNDPVAGDNAPFADAIHYWTQTSPDWIFVGAVDPSLGRQGNAHDPSAILVGGYNRRTGVLDVMEAQIKKRLPDRIIEDVIALQAKYHCQKWAVETVQFQEFLYTELMRRSHARGVPVPAVGIKPHTDKALRIESLQPHMAGGYIRLHPSQQTLISQLRHYPKANHDDGPDALHMLWTLAVSLAPRGGFTVLDRDDDAYDRRMFQ